MTLNVSPTRAVFEEMVLFILTRITVPDSTANCGELGLVVRDETGFLLIVLFCASTSTDPAKNINTINANKLFDLDTCFIITPPDYQKDRFSESDR